MLCDFGCTKNVLYGLNTAYIGVATLLLILSVGARSASVVTNSSIIVGVVFDGIFLLLVSLLGFYGTAKHHQVALFFYMVILSSIFVLQFFVAVACLGTSVSHYSLSDLVEAGWMNASDQIKWDAERSFQCCGLRNSTDYAVSCEKLSCTPSCEPCLYLIVERMSESLQTLGGMGLFFSFFEVIGVWLAMRYRNMKDPDIDPVLYFEQHH